MNFKENSVFQSPVDSAQLDSQEGIREGNIIRSIYRVDQVQV